MKKLFPIALSVLIAGCISSPKMPDATQFVALKTEAPPPELIGLWTGAMGPYISTIEITETGRGRLCSAYASWEGVMGVKYSSGQLHNVGFGAADVSINGRTLVVNPVDDLYPTYQFASDQELVEAAGYCKEQLAER